MAFDVDSKSNLLCLKCRSIGHCAGQCDKADQWPQNSFAWFFSDDRRDLDRLMAKATSVCSRCTDLDILSILRAEIPWRSPQDLIEAQRKGHELIRVIGQSGSIEYFTDCPVCVCLYALTPSPASATEDILLYPDWSWNRLAGENGTELDTEDKRRYTKCLLVALEPNTSNINFYIRGHRGDALAILEEHLPTRETLGARQIQGQRFNSEQCFKWIESCKQLHGTDCDPEYTDELQGIRLVDIVTRTIVAYPGSPCDYAALSYVWGGVEQESYRLGSKLENIPRTIEDAMICAQRLGKRYIWIDSLCIDQASDDDKVDQIGRMWSIYRGSSITIITLSSPSANTGLSRFNDALRPQPQLSCTVGGVRLLGLMPTLSQYIWVESWGNRAWTLQEALLSHRCLYISDHQLYFECETVQYCESLDESRSWVHNLTPSDTPDRLHWLTWIMEQAGSGCLRNLLDTPADRLLHWGQKLTLYSYRAMTKQEDALRAFSGVLQRLETMYTAGFYLGLPIEDFNWALLWQTQWPAGRRSGYPSWCWASWQAGIKTPWPKDIKEPHCKHVPFKAWRAHGGRLLLLFDSGDAHAKYIASSKTEEVEREEVSGAKGSTDDAADGEGDRGDKSEPKQEEGDVQSLEKAFNLNIYSNAEEFGALFLDVLTFTIDINWAQPTHEHPVSGREGFYTQTLNTVRFFVYIMTTDSFIKSETKPGVTTRYLVLAHNSFDDLEGLYVLVVYDVGAYCVRATSMALLIPRDTWDEVLESLQLKRQLVVLA